MILQDDMRKFRAPSLRETISAPATTSAESQRHADGPSVVEAANELRILLAQPEMHA